MRTQLINGPCHGTSIETNVPGEIYVSRKGAEVDEVHVYGLPSNAFYRETIRREEFVKRGGKVPSRTEEGTAP